ncbi:MAG: hypothetical protein Fur0018_05520 [Anaerolineales bacterium]
MNETPLSSNSPADGTSVPEPQHITVHMPAGRPWSVYTLMAVSIGVYLLQLTGQYLLGGDVLATWGVKYAPYIAQGQWWRLVTPIFLHGSILHIGFNMYALYVIGPVLERFWGWRRFLGLYFLAGVAGNVFSLWFTREPSLGSSTAIFGLLAAEGILVYCNGFLFQNPRSTLKSLGNLALINFVIGLSPGIDNWGHLGGFLGGAAFAWLAGPLFLIVPAGNTAYLRDQRAPASVWRAAFVVSLSLGVLIAGWLWVYAVR